MVVLSLIAGFVLLLAGAETLIRGASRLALAIGLSPLVIGLTVVAFGTSAPELAISMNAALRGSPDIALGNVVGSNIANVLLILGITALVAPLLVNRQLVRLDVPVMVVVSLAVCAMALDGLVTRGEGVLLVLCAVAYTTILVRLGRRGAMTSAADVEDAPGPPLGQWWINGLLMLAGLVLLVVGARLLVQAAVSIATAFGLSELVIGLTVIAVGTSLPEIATSLIAALRGQREMAVGNIVGSNIFNLLLVLGLSAIAAPGGVPVSDAAIRFDLPVMAAVAFACLPIFFTGHRIDRWEGGLFFAFYVAYLTYLLLQAAHHDALPAYSFAMMAFVLPLTAITLVVVMLRALRQLRVPRPDAGNPP